MLNAAMVRMLLKTSLASAFASTYPSSVCIQACCRLTTMRWHPHGKQAGGIVKELQFLGERHLTAADAPVMNLVWNHVAKMSRGSTAVMICAAVSIQSFTGRGWLCQEGVC